MKGALLQLSFAKNCRLLLYKNEFAPRIRH